MKNSFFEQYYSLRSKLDNQIARLESLHTNHMVCKQGCSSCCMNFGILAIEFFAIQHEIAHSTITRNDPHASDCIFLENNTCLIYASRPFICRTQGLPNVYYNAELEVWDLSVCELNFTNIEDDSYFTETNCVPMDTYNSHLQQINQTFIEALSLPYANTLLHINSLPDIPAD